MSSDGFCLLLKSRGNVKGIKSALDSCGGSVPSEKRRGQCRFRIMRNFPAFRIVFKYEVISSENP